MVTGHFIMLESVCTFISNNLKQFFFFSFFLLFLYISFFRKFWVKSNSKPTQLYKRHIPEVWSCCSSSSAFCIFLQKIRIIINFHHRGDIGFLVKSRLKYFPDSIKLCSPPDCYSSTSSFTIRFWSHRHILSWLYSGSVFVSCCLPAISHLY